MARPPRSSVRSALALRLGVAAMVVLGVAPPVAASGPPSGDRTDVAYAALPDRFYDEAVATELDQVISLAFLPDGRLLFAEQKSGKIRMILNGRLSTTDPLLVVDSIATVSEELGVVGIAVDAAWPARPYLYVYYDALGGMIRISRYTAVGELAAPGSHVLGFDPASRRDLLRDIPDVQVGHNGGCMRFGNDGMMYVSLGDDMNNCSAQDSTALSGVILRMNVSLLPPGPGYVEHDPLLVPADNPLATHPNYHTRLVWAMGLRNPFRFAVDALDGSLFIADVGWNLWEEVDHATQPGQNFGWPYYEGPRPYLASCPGTVAPGPLTDPVYLTYRGGTVATSTIGGPLYRRPAGCGVGCGYPAEYEGDYFFTEYYTGYMRRLKYSNGFWWNAPPVAGQPNADDWAQGMQQVVDFTIGPDGVIWYARLSIGYLRNTGEIHRIVYTPPAAGAAEAPAQASLEFAAPYPMPARSGVQLEFSLPVAGAVDLAVFDALGRRQRVLLESALRPAGRHRVSWDGRTDAGRPVPPGIYVARLTAGGASRGQRIAWTD